MQQFERELIKAQRDITTAHKKHSAAGTAKNSFGGPTAETHTQRKHAQREPQRRAMRGIVQKKTLGQAP